MVLSESLLGEKTPVVFDLGKAYMKIGFAGEANPRFIFPSPLSKAEFVKGDIYESLKELFHRLCYRHLIVNAKERRVVIVESIMTTTSFRNAIAKVLFRHFEVPSILFAPAHLVSLFTLGISTGLVLDCGYTEALVLPIYEGYTLLSAWHSAPLGSRYVQAELARQIHKSAYVFQDSDSNERLPLSETAEFPEPTSIAESALEDVLTRACFVSPAARASQWAKWMQNPETTEAPNYASESFACPLRTVGEGAVTRLVHIPSRVRELATEVLFTPQDADGETIPSLFLDCLLMCPIDCRRALVENVVCIGGTTMLPGFLERLNEELKASLDLPRYASLAALKDDLKFHSPPAKANYTAWLGGAIFGALDCLQVRSLLRDEYLENPSIPDWDDLPSLTDSSGPAEGDQRHSR